jgi:CTP synthase (UTP-ammonia lyase)
LADEQYHCRFGLNPRLADRLISGPIRPVAWNLSEQVRAIELDSHPFFVATLFQPERAALTGQVPPIVAAFFRAAMARPNR